MKNKTGKRLLSFLMAVLLLLCEAPTVSFAADLSGGTESAGDVSESDVSAEDISEGDVSEGDVTAGDMTAGDALEGDVTDGNAEWEIPEMNYAGEIPVSDYETLKKALETDTTNRIVLTENINYICQTGGWVDAIDIKAGNHTIDMNGKTLTISVQNGETTIGGKAIWVTNSASLTITDSSGSRGMLCMDASEAGTTESGLLSGSKATITIEKVTLKVTAKYAQAVSTYNCTLTMTDCRVESAAVCVKFKGENSKEGKAFLKNCVMESSGYRTLQLEGSYPVTIEGGSYRNTYKEKAGSGSEVVYAVDASVIYDHADFYSENGSVLRTSGVGESEIWGGSFESSGSSGSPVLDLGMTQNSYCADEMKIYAATIKSSNNGRFIVITNSSTLNVKTITDIIPVSTSIEINGITVNKDSLKDNIVLSVEKENSVCVLTDQRNEPQYQITDVEVTVPNTIYGKTVSETTVSTGTENVNVSSVIWEGFLLGQSKGIISGNSSFRKIYDYRVTVCLSSDSKFFPQDVERKVKVNGVEIGKEGKDYYYVSRGKLYICYNYDSPNKVKEISLTVQPPEYNTTMNPVVKDTSGLYDVAEFGNAFFINPDQAACLDKIYYLTVPVSLAEQEKIFAPEQELSVNINSGQKAWEPVSVEIQRVSNRSIQIIIGIKAVERYDISITNGCAMDRYGRKINSALEGELVYLTAQKDTNEVFLSWNGLDDVSSAGNFTTYPDNMTFASLLAHPRIYMPKGDINAEAVFQDAEEKYISRVEIKGDGFYDGYQVADAFAAASSDYRITQAILWEIREDGTQKKVSTTLEADREYAVTLLLSANVVGKSFFNAKEKTEDSRARTLVGTVNGYPIVDSWRTVQDGVVYAGVRCYVGKPGYRIAVDNGAIVEGGLTRAQKGSSILVSAPAIKDGRSFSFWSVSGARGNEEKEEWPIEHFKSEAGAEIYRKGNTEFIRFNMTEQNISISPVYTTADQLVDTLTLSDVKMPQVDVKLPDVTGISAEESAVKTIMGNWVLLPDYVDYDNLSIENFNELEGVDDTVPEKGQYGLHYGLAVVIDLEEGKYFAPENVEAAMADKKPAAIVCCSNKAMLLFDFGCLTPEGIYIRPVEDQIYMGTALRPSPAVYCGGVRLKEGTDYTVSYKNNIKAADKTAKNAPTVTVTGRKNYKGKVTAVFSILPADLGSASGITAEPLYVKASGKQVFGKPVIRYNGKIVPASEYTLTYEGKDNMNNFAKPGEYNITVTGKGNNFTGKLTVKQYNLENITVVFEKDSFVRSYTGDRIVLLGDTYTVYAQDKKTKLGAGDYKVTYENNVKAGKATMIITGQGNYTGVVKKTFTITPASMDTENISVVNSPQDRDWFYTGKMVCPKDFMLRYGTINLREGVDYTVAYKNNKTVGKTADKKAPVVVIKGKGNYKGTMEFTFNILPADISGFSKDADAPSVLYRNTKNNYVTKPVIKDINGGKLVPGKDYELVEYKVYNENTATWENITADRVELPAGKDYVQMQVTVKGKGNFTGTCVLTYRMTAYSVRQFTVEKIADREFCNAPYDNPAAVVVRDKVSGVALTYNKDYRLRFENNLYPGTAIVYIDGLGAYSGTVRQTFRIKPASLAARKPDGTQVLNGYLKVVSAPGSYKFTGKDIRPEDIVLQDIGGYRLVKGVDYTLSYKNNKNAFTYVAGTNEAKAPAVIVNGKGNYTGKLCLYFSIMQADISGTDNKGNPRITVSAPDVLYRDVKNNYIPKITVTDAYGKKLTAGKDYDKNVQYKLVSTGSIVSGDRVSMGTKTELLMEAVIAGTGNYTGSYTFRYRIYSADIKTAAVGKNGNEIYTGRPICPKMTVTYGKDRTLLTEGVDYTLQYVNNVNTGTATVIIRGMGSYGGEKKVTFKIVSRELTWWEELLSSVGSLFY